MFSAPFEAWKYGPVVVEVRDLYRKDALNVPLTKAELEVYKPIFDYVFMNYADKDSWSLSNLTHSETSWKNARKGLGLDEHCSNGLDMEDIRKEASDKTILISTHAIAMKGALEALDPAAQGMYWAYYVKNCAVFYSEPDMTGGWTKPVPLEEGDILGRL